MPGVAGAEDAHHRVIVGAADRLPVGHDRPAPWLPVLGQVGHGRYVGLYLDGQPAALGRPAEEPVLDVGDRDRPGVVVGLLSLLLGPPVPGRAALVGAADQGVAVELLQAFLGHDDLLQT